EASRVAEEVAASKRRAPPARSCMLPNCSVETLSPGKMVLPTVAAMVPTWACSAEVTVPSGAAEPAPQATGEPRRTTEARTEDTTRSRDITVSKRAGKSILSQIQHVNEMISRPPGGSGRWVRLGG